MTLRQSHDPLPERSIAIRPWLLSPLRDCYRYLVDVASLGFPVQESVELINRRNAEYDVGPIDNDTDVVAGGRRLRTILERTALRTVIEFRHRLQQICDETAASHARALRDLARAVRLG